ncbi:MAG: DPP IV N-terminal domain-containing protein [Flavobacteriales bacterium]
MNHRILLFISFIFIILSVSSQEKKDLTLEETVLPWMHNQWPESWQNVQFLPSDKQFSFVFDEKLHIRNVITPNKTEVEIELSKLLPKGVKRTTFYWISDTEATFEANNQLFRFNLKSLEPIKILDFPSEAKNLDIHHKNNLIAYTHANNLFIANSNSKSIPVTSHSDKNIVAGQSIARSEMGITKGTFWSPNGNFLAFYEKDETHVADYPLLDNESTPGKLISIKYPMAGQKSEIPKVGIYDVVNNKTTYLDIPVSEDYVTNLSWDSEEKFILLAQVSRSQKHMKLNKYNVSNGKFVSTLFEESNEKWVEPENPAVFLPNNNGFLWMSEREGFMNVYHYQHNGKLVRNITPVKWVVKHIEKISPKGDFIIVSGTGPDPRETHYYRFNIKNGSYVALTKTHGTHNAAVSNNATMVLSSYSNTESFKKVAWANGKIEVELFSAANPYSDKKIGKVEWADVTSEDGHKLYGRIIYPYDFDAKKTYPAMVYVYGGPHAQLVTDNWLHGASAWMFWMANQGYIVYTLDNRGSANRGFAFESVIHRKLGEHEMKDQLKGIEYLKSLPFVNSERMAVHGWSYGGFMTTSLMLHQPDVFKIGVAGGPVIDWKWYEVMYGERYMDTPEENPKGYEHTSLINHVKKLKGKLLMIHGTIDDVVVMQHNLAFIQKCVDEDIYPDFFPYPMHKHNVGGKDRVHLMRKVLTYIIDNMPE